MSDKTLRQAVTEEAEAFLQNGTPFSSHDITAEIRTKVTNKIYDVTDCNPLFSSGQHTRIIRHDAVKKVMKDICTQRPDILKEYNTNSGYIVYSLDKNTPVTATSVATPSDASTSSVKLVVATNTANLANPVDLFDID